MSPGRLVEKCADSSQPAGHRHHRAEPRSLGSPTGIDGLLRELGVTQAPVSPPRFWSGPARLPGPPDAAAITTSPRWMAPSSRSWRSASLVLLDARSWSGRGRPRTTDVEQLPATGLPDEIGSPIALSSTTGPGAPAASADWSLTAVPLSIVTSSIRAKTTSEPASIRARRLPLSDALSRRSSPRPASADEFPPTPCPLPGTGWGATHACRRFRGVHPEQRRHPLRVAPATVERPIERIARYAPGRSSAKRTTRNTAKANREAPVRVRARSISKPRIPSPIPRPSETRSSTVPSRIDSLPSARLLRAPALGTPTTGLMTWRSALQPARYWINP